jgi:hypothetical protein
MDLSDEQGAEALALNSGLSIGEPEFSELPIRYLVGESEEYRDYAIVQDVALEIEIRWSEQGKRPPIWLGWPWSSMARRLPLFYRRHSRAGRS